MYDWRDEYSEQIDAIEASLGRELSDEAITAICQALEKEEK